MNPLHAATPARRRLNLAVVTETWPPEVNGVSLSLHRMVSGLMARGHRVQLVRPRQGPQDRPEPAEGLQQVLRPGFPIPRYPQLRMGLPGAAALRRLWRAQRPDLVHIATEGPLGHSAASAAAALGLQASSDFRTNFHAYSAHYGIGWLRRPIMGLLRHFHNRCAFTAVPTAALARELAAEGFERLEVVSRGVDLKRFDPAHRSAALRAQWGADDGDPVALYVGRLAAEKNLALLVRAWPALRAAQPRLKLVLVGDGPEAPALRIALPQARFAGSRSGHDLAAHYASADLFVFPSRTETFGNVVPEAMASGLPVVAFNHAAAGELVVTGLSGALARDGDDAGFIAAAAGLLATPEALGDLGHAARRTARERDWDSVIDRLEWLMLRAAQTPLEIDTAPLAARHAA